MTVSALSIRPNDSQSVSFIEMIGVNALFVG